MHARDVSGDRVHGGRLVLPRGNARVSGERDVAGDRFAARVETDLPQAVIRVADIMQVNVRFEVFVKPELCTAGNIERHVLAER